MRKISFCFYGQPRFIGNLNIVRTYHQIFNGIDAEIDTYGHTWFEQGTTYISSSWVESCPDYKSDQYTIEKLYHYYKFKNLMIEPPKVFKFVSDDIRNHYKNIKGRFCFSETSENNILSQLYSIENSMKLAPDDRDLYVLCRYDTLLLNFPNLNELLVDKLYLSNVGLFPDAIMIMGKRFLPWIRNIYTASQTKIFDMEMFIPEYFKEKEFIRQGFTYNDIIHDPVKVQVVRN